VVTASFTQILVQSLGNLREFLEEASVRGNRTLDEAVVQVPGSDVLVGQAFIEDLDSGCHGIRDPGNAIRQSTGQPDWCGQRSPTGRGLVDLRLYVGSLFLTGHDACLL
jgi:hypothetical protein